MAFRYGDVGGVTVIVVSAATFIAIAGTTSKEIGSASLWSRFRDIDNMTGQESELFMADVFEAAGYRSEVVGSSGDQGVDILLRSKDRRIAVQCKKYVKPVGNKPIQEVFAGAKYHGTDDAWVVAPNGYTKGARQLAEKVRVSLYDREGIAQLIRQTTDLENDIRRDGTANQE